MGSLVPRVFPCTDHVAGCVFVVGVMMSGRALCPAVVVLPTGGVVAIAVMIVLSVRSIFIVFLQS